MVEVRVKVTASTPTPNTQSVKEFYNIDSDVDFSDTIADSSCRF